MYENQTEENIKARMLAKMDVPVNKGEGSDLSNISAGPALIVSEGYAELDYIIKLIMGEVLDDSLIPYAASFGVFHKEGEKAADVITIIGTPGTNLAAGTLMKSDKSLVYLLDEDISIGSEPVLVGATAEGVGYKYNDNSGSLSLVIDNPGVTSITYDGFVGGVDVESLESLSERLLEKFQNPSSSGNENDYKRWATSVVGVTKCKVLSRWNGNGTVKCIVYGENGQPLTTEKLAEVAALIESLRPITANVTVVTVSNLMAAVKVSGLLFDPAVGEVQTKENMEKAMSDYIDAIEPGVDLVYKQLLAAAVQAKGVVDVTNILVNDASVNIPSTDEQKIKMGAVTYEA